MFCLCQYDISKKMAKLMPAFWVMLSLGFLPSTPCVGQPAFPAVPQISDWTVGPAVTSLGEVADLKIPRGYKFTDAEGARRLLKDTKNVIPAGLLGVLAPEEGNWWILLKYSDA